MNVAVIPARGGSKRVPNKNMKLFAGKPIIAYSIEAAQRSGVFSRIIVSTDSEEIARVARECGAETPFLRPAELSGDFTPTAPVLLHALEWLHESGFCPEYLCCIYATAPFVGAEYIRQGLELVRREGVTSAFSVTTFPFPILRALRITESGAVTMFWPEYEMARSNDLEEAYHDAGQFYWLDCPLFQREQKLYGSQSLPVILPRYLVQDIDTPEDWETAERMFAAMNETGRRSEGREG
jgi:pseudaminic acid cytidylyltransferase